MASKMAKAPKEQLGETEGKKMNAQKGGKVDKKAARKAKLDKWAKGK
jgi:hypothetical protein